VARRDGQPFSDGAVARLDGRTWRSDAAPRESVHGHGHGSGGRHEDGSERGSLDAQRLEHGHDEEEEGGGDDFGGSSGGGSGCSGPLVGAKSGVEAGSRVLVALRWREASVKLAVKAKLRAGLKLIGSGRGFQNFLKPGSMPLNRGQKTTIHGTVDWERDFRFPGSGGNNGGGSGGNSGGSRSGVSSGNDGGGGGGGDGGGGSGKSGSSDAGAPSWVARAWCVVVLTGPRTLGSEQLRRMAGALVAFCRGAEGDAYLQRLHAHGPAKAP
jgi:hypothetical protein